MLYLKTSNGQHVLILEPANLERIKDGEPAVSPNKEVMVMYTPDAPWLSDELTRAAFDGQMSAEKLDFLVKRSLERPAVTTRAYEPMQQVVKEGQLTGTTLFSKKPH